MKSILISIKPEWVAKILNGDKTIEYATLYIIDRAIKVYQNMRQRCYNHKSSKSTAKLVLCGGGIMK